MALPQEVQRIGFGATGPARARQTVQDTIDELFSLMKPPSID
jgi:hypothetical protein